MRNLFVKVVSFVKSHWVALCLAIIPAFIFFLIASKSTLPSYSVSDPINIASLSNESPQLKILWNEEEIENLYTTQIIIWNRGREHLDANDFKSFDPIRISFTDNVTPLDWQINKKSRENMQVSLGEITKDENYIIIDFNKEDSIEPKEGFRIKILHTASSEASMNSFDVMGGIVGSRQGWKKLPWTSIENKIFSIENILSFIVGIVFFALSVLFFTDEIGEFSEKGVARLKTTSRILSFLSGIVLIAMSFALSVFVLFRLYIRYQSFIPWLN